MTTSYDIHPSAELRELFSSMPIPYQGQDPAQARIIFVGLDANYSADIFAYENMRDRILEYHQDGVEFWKRHDTHHPFLLDEYPLKKNRGGVPYHRKFQTMGLTAKHAEFIIGADGILVTHIASVDTKIDMVKGREEIKSTCFGKASTSDVFIEEASAIARQLRKDKLI